MKLVPILMCCCLVALAQDEPPEEGGRGAKGNEDPINTRTFASLRARQIGPAMIFRR